ncbi:hypothetical protein ACLB2K_042870 [Fragaria x ananassa]
MDMEVDLPNLPNDILWFQILTRLPAKSLMRFKCVCKFWSSSLFRDPRFVRAHRNMHKNQNRKKTHLLLSDWSTTTLFMFSMQLKHELGFLNSPTLQADIDVLLSQNTQMTSSNSPWRDTSRSFGVNGLIYLCNEDAAVPVRIFNPCTREFTTLPVSQFVPGLQVLNTYHIGFEIFTLGSTSKSWRDVPKIGFGEEWHPIDGKTVCVHGAIHWAVMVMKMKRQTTIVAFDVGEYVIPLPQDWSDSERFYNMIQVNGCLAIYENEFYNRRRTTSIGIWILKDYQNQVWIEESIVLPEERCKLGWPVPLCTIHTGELLLYCSKNEEGFSDVHLYDMKRKSYRKTEIKFWGRILAAYDERTVPL